MTTPAKTANQQIARAASTVMLAFVFSQLAGLLRYILVASRFGTSLEMEAFTAANRVPDTIFKLMAGGALASAFIPTFTGLLAQEKKQQAWQLASAIANLLLLVLSLASLIAAAFAPQIVATLLAPGFAARPEQMQLTVDLMRLMLPSAAIFGLSGLVMGILNSHQVFLVPALTPAMYSLGIIAGVVFLTPRLGIYGLGWGALLGAALHLLLQIPTLLRQRGQYFPILGLRLPAVREVARLMGPRLIGVAVVELNFWLNIWLASFMPTGSVNGVNYAFTLMLMPQAVIAQSIAIAAMPTFARQVSLGRFDEMRQSLAASLRGVLLLAIPASLGLVMLRLPLVKLVYFRGAFDEHSAQLVAWALLWYGAGLVGHSLVEVAARAFYAMHDTRTPVMVGAAAMGLNLLFSLLFSAWFIRLGWMPHGGLALANSLATFLEMCGLLFLMRRRLGGLEGGWIAKGVVQMALAALAMSAALAAWLAFTTGQPAWLAALGGIAIGAAIYGAAALALGVSEARAGVGWVLRRIGRPYQR